MFTLRSEITIGGYRLGGVNEVKITRSIYELAARAVVKVPVTAVLKQKGTPPARVETAKAIKRGDRVVIKLGYDSAPREEFRGYVRNINLTTPVEIECEDEFYKCRERKVKLKGGTTTLADILKLCGLTAAYAETLTLKNFAIVGKSSPTVAQVLAKLRTDYGLNIFFDLAGKIYACRAFRVVGDTVKYELRRNVIKDDQLKYHKKEDVKIEIKAICIKRDGSRIEATKGDKEGTERTLYFYDVESVQELTTLVEQELQRHSYDGYEGTIETFLVPFAAPTMVASITDPVYGEKNGDYYIEGVETTFGRGGARRKIEIGLKL